MNNNIKRYLSRVGTLEKDSKAYNSRYYTIPYETKTIIVRFSDHFSENVKKIDINIIELPGNLYYISADSLIYTVSSKEVLTYIKSILLIYPELLKLIQTFKKGVKKTSKDRSKLLNKINILEQQISNHKEDWELVDSIYEENKKLKKDLNKAEKQLVTSRKLRDSLKNKLVEVNSIIGMCKSFAGNI